MAKLFDIDKSGISRHLNKIFKVGELEKEVVIAKIVTITQHGAIADKTQQSITSFYNLDAILLVGYRVNSEREIKFRKWANSILKKYILEGYAVNEKRLEVLNKTIEVQNNIIAGFVEMSGMDAKDVLDVIKQYSTALNMIDDYDHQNIKSQQDIIQLFIIYACKGSYIF